MLRSTAARIEKPRARAGRAHVVAGLALVAAAGIAAVRLTERWSPRIPPGWSMRLHFVGTNTDPDPATNAFPDKDLIAEYERSIRIVSEAGRPGSITVEDRDSFLAAGTNRVVWEYVVREQIDPRTGRHADPRYAEDILVFPRNTEKRTYRVRSNYLKGVPVTFDRVEEIDGLETYVFAYRGRGEYTEAYAGTPDYPGVPVPPGHEIRCRDDQMYLYLWVEPATGTTVKIEEGCPSGDYIYDPATGRRGRAVARWSGVTAGDALVESVRNARAARARYLWPRRGVALAGLLGLLLAALGLRMLATRPTATSPEQALAA